MTCAIDRCLTWRCSTSRTAARKIRGFRDGFEEPLADRRDLVTERTGAKEGAISPRISTTGRTGGMRKAP